MQASRSLARQHRYRRYACVRRANRAETEAGLNRNRTADRHYLTVGMLLPEVVIERPTNALLRLGCESKELILEAISGFDLVRAIHQPVVNVESIVQRDASSHAHVIEGQKVKPVGARVVDLIFCVVPLNTE